MPPAKLKLEELRAGLRAPLPAEAIKPDHRRPWLSVINPAYVVERLNDCFGEDGWQAAYKITESAGEMIVVLCTFTATRYKIVRRAYGGNANEDRGDAYKGACTDALTKAASYLGIGADVYKGLHDNQTAGAAEDPGEHTPAGRRDAAKPIRKFEIAGFLDAIARTGKTDAQVNEFLTKECSITSIDQMTRGVFRHAINWANWDGDPRKVQTIDAGRQKQPMPAAAPAEETGPPQRRLFQ